MTPERRLRIATIVREALSLDDRQRSAFLGKVCDGDAALRSDVDATLAAQQTPARARESDSAGDTTVSLPDPCVDAPTANASAMRYRFGRELARGGMGAVHEAFDLRLSRTVAIKRLLAPTSQAAARLKREALITARLQHPAVVPVFDIGDSANGPFYAMKLVEGIRLDVAIERAATLDQRLALLAHAVTVVDAVAYAHSRGIVHRDLKPHNVLVGPFGETVVVDWGVAKDVGAIDETATVDTSSDENLTRVGAVVGTPAYMAPEQAAGAPVDARADVYALGAMLYQLLTGCRPRAGQPAIALLESEPELPVDLVTIVEKAMATDPARRYATAGEMTADLRRFQTGQLVGAHQYTAWQLFRRLVARSPAAVSLAALVIFALLAAMAVIVVRQGRLEQTRALKRALDGEILDLENAMAATGDASRLRELENRLDDRIVHARVASQELAGAGAPIWRGGDALDRGIHRVLGGFDADTYSIPPRFRTVVAAGLDRSRKIVLSAAVQDRKRAVWPIIKRELDTFGLPDAVGYIAWRESGLNAFLVFAAGDAAGLWQFRRRTAQDYGLRIDATTDERLDPAKSTHAAIGMLADLFAEFGDDATLMALMAYPLGVDKTRAFVHEIATEKGGWRSGHRSYWHLYRTHRMSREAEDYAPGIIALMLADGAGQ